MTSDMNLPASLAPSLETREAISDALHRFMVGMDTNDSALFDPAFTLDARWDLYGRVMNGLEEIHEKCFMPL
jgi:hypothetical protein